MKLLHKIFLILLVLIPSLVFSNSLKDMAENLRDYSLTKMNRVDIKKYHIDLTYGELFLNNGELYLTGFINDEPTTAYFFGSGKFVYYPPDAIEAQQVRKFYNTDTLTLKFSQVYLVSPAIPKLFKSLIKDVHPTRPRSRIKRQLREIRNIPDKKFKYDLPLQISRAIIEGKSDYLWLDIQKGRFNHTIYLNNPYDIEPISIYKLSSGFKNPQLVSSYPIDKTFSKLAKDNQYNLFEYDIDINISTYARSNISCTMSIKIVDDSLKTIRLGFPREYKVDRVTGDVADSIAFFKRREYPGLTVELQRFYYHGDTIIIGVEYRTNLFYHFMNGGVIQDHLTHWYPYHGFRLLSDYNIRYRIDKGYSFIAVGDRVVDSTDGAFRIYEYQTENPAAYISFNYGLFDTLRITDSNLPITIYSLARQKKSKLFKNPALDELANDIHGSFNFYDKHFAPYPFRRLDVAAMSVAYGQGSPGFVHLPTYTFVKTYPGIDDKLRAHEVAHQWWGHLVHPATYHDIWLSEGFAEYSAALFIEKGKDDKRLFRNILKNWKKRIVQKGGRGGRKSVGFRSGSIYLGWRLGAENSSADYENIVYCKAAYLLHMLRYELEIKSENPDIFFDLLSDYAACYSGQMATTGDFIEVTRKYLGERTDQFFEQWLYGWQVPKIKKKKKIRKDGLVNIYLNVINIPDSFETLYPIRYHFGNEKTKTVVYRLKAGKNIVEFSPDSSVRVKEVKFNPNYDILEQ